MNLLVYDLVKALVTVFYRLTTSWRVYGRQNIPREGSLVLVANHFSLADPLIIGSSVTRRLSFIAKQELFSNILLKTLMRELGAIPVRRGQVARDTMRAAERVLAEGRVIALFPEGGRSLNGQVGDGFSGAALIAARSGAPLVPVGISGTDAVTGFRWLLHRPRVTVNVGQPFWIEHSGGPVSSLLLKESTDYVMASIASLVEPARRGKYGDWQQSPYYSSENRIKEPALKN